MAEACRLDEGNPGLDLGLALGEGWEDGPRQGLRPEPGRLRPLGRAADRRVDGQGGQGPRARAGRVGRRARPPGAGGAPRSRRTSSARSSSAGSSRPRSPARSSASTRSTSRTCRRRRTRRTRCSPAATSSSSRRGLARRAARAAQERRLRLHPGVRQPDRRPPSAAIARARRARPRGDRLRRHARLRPALPALDRASCTRAGPNTGVFIQVVDDYRRGAEDPRPAVRLRRG